MGELVEFPTPGRWLQGTARCIGCRHEWQAVSEVGVFEDLECPTCGAFKGVRLSVVTPDDDTVWRCNCGNEYFLLVPVGAPMCANCGHRATSWADG